MFCQRQQQEEQSDCDYSEVKPSPVKFSPTDEKFLLWLSEQSTVSY